jgi:hypothetical protein
VFSPGQTLTLLSGEAPGEGVGLGVVRVDGGAPDLDRCGVLWSSHASVMSLCRRFFGGGRDDHKFWL